jgi:hypothetical protein
MSSTPSRRLAVGLVRGRLSVTSSSSHTVCRQAWPCAACLCSTDRTSIFHVQLPTALKRAHIHHVSVTSVHQHLSLIENRPDITTPSLVGCRSLATCHVALQVTSVGLTGHTPQSDRQSVSSTPPDKVRCQQQPAHVHNEHSITSKLA